jgi:two-component system, OmpR family, sensor histidine kinase ChvG
MKFLLSIRGKLLLVSLILLAIPLLGYQFIRDMESYLREGQERALESSTRAIAVTLSERPHLFAKESNPDDQAALERRQVLALFGSSDPETVASLGAAYQPSEEIERFLEVVGRRASRVWVVDTQSRVRGLYGSLKNRTPAETNSGPSVQVSKALTRLFDIPSPDAKDDPKSAAKAVMAHVDRALIGAPSSFWRITQDKRGIVLSSAQPIWSGDNIVGAVVVEETTGAIQLLKLNALENLLTITAIVFVVGFLTLVLFAWRLAARVRSTISSCIRAIKSRKRRCTSSGRIKV